MSYFVSLFLGLHPPDRAGASQSLGQQAVDSGAFLGRVFRIWEVAMEAGAGMLEAVRVGLRFDPTVDQGWCLCHLPLCMEKKKFKTKSSFFGGCGRSSVSQIPKSWHTVGHLVLLCWPVV